MKVGFWRCSGLIVSLCVVHMQDSTASCRTQAEQLKQQCITTRRVSVDDCKTQQRVYYQTRLSSYNQDIKTAREALGECTKRTMQELSQQLEDNPQIDNEAAAKEYINSHKEEMKAYLLANCGAQKSQMDDILDQKPKSTEDDCERDYYGACNAEFNDALSMCGRN